MDLNNKLFRAFMLMETGNGGGGGSSKRPYGSRMTPEAQAEARAYWHVFVGMRQAKGLCIQCQRKHQPGLQRCKTHRKLNAAKCLKWARANRDAIRAEYKYRVENLLCVNNPKHGRSFDGHIHCLACYTRRKVAKAAKRTS